ncbi:MAG: class I tRNA ligase family protein, partial [Candidatus Omnitrophota bacterium]|nr:class I tRNA ligase family protein [Candidatus Omnitrophota bacterium]
ERERNSMIKKISEDFDNYKFNTVVSNLMILMNSADRYRAVNQKGTEKKILINRTIRTIVRLLSPIAPHLAEELWQTIGGKEESIVRAAWPTYEESALKQDKILVVVQVNGKLRGKFDVSVDIQEEELKTLALNDAKIQEFVQHKPIKKFIYVPGKLINLVV